MINLTLKLVCKQFCGVQFLCMVFLPQVVHTMCTLVDLITDLNTASGKNDDKSCFMVMKWFQQLQSY